MTVYRCNWKQYQNLVDTVEFSAFLPLMPRQKIEVLGYAVASINYRLLPAGRHPANAGDVAAAEESCRVSPPRSL